MKWRTVLEALEARLAELARGGIQTLNVASDPELAQLLASFPAGEGAAPAAEAPASPELTPAPPRAPPVPEIPQAEPAGLADRAPPLDSGGSAATSAAKHPSELHTLESLHFHFRDCQRCALAGSRTKLVFGVGHDRPRLMFVGEGPGQEEDRQGLPFVGRAGALLTAGILALGLTREDVYIANMVKCRPPGNRNPAPEETAACFPILSRQMELLDPALIVTLGNVPLKALNPSARGITAERGRVFEHRQWPVLPTFHPAYLLRNANAIDSWWLDLKQAFRLAYGSGG